MKNYALPLLKVFFLLFLTLPMQAQFMPCSFTAHPDSASPGTVIFNFNTNPGNTNPIEWDFGDNTFGTGPQVSHTYNGVGPYNVCASQIDSLGHMICRFCDMISPQGPAGPHCNFNFSADPNDSLGMLFHASSGMHASATWDFGDGMNGSGLQVPHHYPGPGTYTVCMTLVDTVNGAIQTCTHCEPVVVAPPVLGPHCSFHVSSAPMGAGSLAFSAIVGPGTMVNWDFGDGTHGQGHQIVHAYNHPGTYQVCMTESDSLGNIVCHFCHPVMASGHPGNACQFNFMVNPANFLEVNFNSQAGPGTTMVWDFGDSTAASGPNVSHIFGHPGIFNVCNTLLDTAGNIICHNCQLVNIHQVQPPQCHANFHAMSLGLTGYFIDASRANPARTTYSWDFGDGGTSNVRFPQHVYSAPGVYLVCLDITDSLCTDHFCHTLVVDTNINQPMYCNAFFVTLQMAPYQLTVVNMSSGMNLNFDWDFGDGTTSTQRFPSHSYSTTGTYILCLTVTSNNPAGALCTSTFCDTVSVDSSGTIYRMSNSGFTVNVVSPDQITGVSSISSEKFFSVYPNPVNDILNIQLNAKGESSYRVLNINGAEITSGKFNSSNNVLKTSEWNSGFYLLEITRNDGTRNFEKFIKE